MKRLVDLTAEDLRNSPVWRYEGGTGAEALVEPADTQPLSQEDDEIFLAATEFQMADGSGAFGFCFPADDSGIDYLQPVILGASGPIRFWFDGPADPQILAAQWQALGRKPEQIFPISFHCLVPVDGRTVSGRIHGVGSSQDLTSGPPAPAIGDDVPAPERRAGRTTRVPTARPVQARRNTGPVEKRTARRRKATMTVEFDQGPLRGKGVTRDVSPRGLFIQSPRLPGTGPMLRLKVNLPGGRTLVLEGRVVRGAADISTSTPTPGFGLRLSREWPRYSELFPKRRDKPE